MKTYIALLRGINVGGNNIIPMSELKSICEGLCFEHVRTYIQSGNVLFKSVLAEEELIKKLEDALFAEKNKHLPVIIRSAEEMESVIADNPFPDAEPAKVGVTFFKELVPEDALASITIPGSEEINILGREIFVHYPEGMGRSKLKFPKALQGGTVRNINSVNKLVEMSRDK